MDNTETKQPEEQVIITYNDKQYRASDLNDEQLAIAGRLNLIARKLSSLQSAYDDYVMTDDYKKIVIEAFDRSINKEETVEEVEEK
jgi:hypothetical protein|tara:strand:+ start:562 stop:819 length:258 start_codon:yes stop_codon:yes gene_type:complete